VRADGTVVSDPNRAAAPPAPRTNTAAPVSNTPLALNNPSGNAGPVVPPARPSTTAPASQNDNPWANVVGSNQLSAPATNQAALAPQATAPAANPPPIVAVNTPPPAGSYVVQVAAQKTEADAAATWQQLQQKYPTVLGSQQASIRRVDLGERGVFYRAQVGPFGSRAQASEVCQSLKAAGGECVIQRN
jgi:cell division septation protein DedD